MSAENRDPIPMTILTGFLGAGKTTLLNRILSENHGQRIAVMVNDFGAINIDAQLIVDVEGEETVNLSNGCICCTIRDDFLQATLQLCERPDPPDYIIIETSGVADPLEVALTFRYIPQVTIDSILTIIDAEQILDIDREHTILAMNQVGMADIVMLNKVDLVDEKQLQKARDYIREITPQSRIFETSYAHIPMELLLNIGEYELDHALQREPESAHLHEANTEQQHDHEHNHALVFDTWSWAGTEPVAFRALKRAVESLPVSIYRAKGIFQLADEPDQKAVLQVVGKRVTLTLESWQNEIPSSRLVVIGKHGDVDASALQQKFDGCLASHAPKNEVERIARTALTWLRGK